MSVLKRLTVLQNEAAATPVPSRKYFHIGKPEEVGDVGECVPMLSWVDDNLSRYVVSDSPSSSWGRDDVWLTGLPNVTVANGDGVFLVSGHGRDRSEDNPRGTGKLHFVHLGLRETLVARGLRKLYVYKLDGVQVKNLPAP